MAAFTVTVTALIFIGALLLWMFGRTLTQEQAQQELDDYVMRRLRYRDDG